MPRRKPKKSTKKIKKKRIPKEKLPYIRPYRIGLMINGYEKKFLSITIKQESFIKKLFNELIEKNEQEIIFPKTVMLRNRKYIPAVYTAHLLVDPNEVTKYMPPPEYDENGNELPINLLFDKYVSIRETPFLVEETFYVYKYHHLIDRKDFAWIYSNIVEAHQDQPVRTALRYKNKIVIFNDDIFDMIICKIEDEAKKLYTMLKGVSIESKNTAVAFMGTCAKENNWRIFDRIQTETGWHEDRIWASTSLRYK